MSRYPDDTGYFHFTIIKVLETEQIEAPVMLIMKRNT